MTTVKDQQAHWKNRDMTVKAKAIEHITVTLNFSCQLISSLLCSAFESGGINYWARIAEVKSPAKLFFRSDKEQTYPHLDYPLNPGGYVLIEDTEADKPTKYKIDLESIQKGLQIMAEKYPKHFADIQREDFDMNTADVFIQCCCFGETLYS